MCAVRARSSWHSTRRSRRLARIRPFERPDAAAWGRLVETAVGAHLVNSGAPDGVIVTYWRDRDREVDLVLERGSSVLASRSPAGQRRTISPASGASRIGSVLQRSSSEVRAWRSREFLSRPAGDRL